MIRSDKQHLFPERKRVEGRVGWAGREEGGGGKERAGERDRKEDERAGEKQLRNL